MPDREEGAARGVPVIGPGIEVPEVVAERPAVAVAGQPVAEQRQVVGQSRVHEGHPNPAGILSLGPRGLQGLGPFQRPEIAFKLVEIPPAAALRPDRPPGPDCAPSVGDGLNGRLRAFPVMCRIGNQELAQPAAELPPLDSELVRSRQQQADDDSPGVPVIGPAGLVQQPAAGQCVLRIEAGKPRPRAQPLHGETQPAGPVAVSVSGRARRHRNRRGERECRAEDLCKKPSHGACRHIRQSRGNQSPNASRAVRANAA